MEKYTAIITEPRIHPAWKLVLNNFLTNLDERWNFLIFWFWSIKKLPFISRCSVVFV